MEKSIEQIWKSGFIQESQNIPKIKQLDQLQSIYFVDSFKKKYQINVIALMLTALMVLPAFILGGIPMIGFFMFGLFASLALLGQIEILKLNQLNQADSNYVYLRAFDEWLKKLEAKFAWIYRIWVPLLFVGFALALLQTNFFVPFLGETLIERFTNTPPSDGLFTLPLFWNLGIFGLAGLLSFLADFIFKKEMQSIYGDLMAKIEALLRELRKLDEGA